MNDLLLPAVQKSTQDLDPYYNLVSLHLKGDVSTGRNYNAFSDASSNNFRLTNNGDVRGTSFSPYNTSWSNFFSSASSGYLSGSANISGSGSWTYEAFVYLTAYAPGGFGKGIVSTDGTSQGWSMRIQPDGRLILGERLFSNYVVSNDVVPLNTWVHVAAVRSGTTVSLFVNGVLQPTTGSFTQNLSSSTFVVGRTYTSQAVDYWDGYLSNVRVVSGQALYSGNFTPPAVPFTTTTVGSTGAGAAASLTGTITLLTCQSNRFRDASSNNTPLTVNGSPTVSSFAPFLDTDTTSGSGYFDGTGDYLNNTTINATFTGEFTFEGWVFVNTYTNPTVFFGIGSEATNRMMFGITNSGQLFANYYGQPGSFLFGSAGSVTLNTWHHIAFVRSSSNINAYLNGVAQGTAASYSTTVGNSGGVGIGATQEGYYPFTGYLSNVRYTPQALYTSTFTPPIAPLAASGTNPNGQAYTASLLTLQERGAYNTVGFQDQSEYQHVITRNPATGPNAPAQGTFSPFSQTGWSNYFVTAGNYLLGNSSTLGGTSVSTFTIDGWVYPTSFGSGGDLKIIGDVTPDSYSDYISISLTSTGQIKLHWYDGTTKTCTTNSTVSLNSWGYFAVVVSSNAISIYINSSSASSLTGTTTLTARAGTFNCCIAQFYGVAFPGYLSNIRVSTVARTVSVPTLPFVSDANTRFLTCQDNRFVNNGAAGITITPNGSTSVQAFSPFKPPAYDPQVHGGSGYFDGTGDYLALPTSNATLYPGSGAFTFECWIYPTGTLATLQSVFSYGGSAGNLRVFIQNGGLQLWNGATSFTAGNTALVKNNSWNHIVVQRDSSNYFTSYVNGTRDYYTVQTVDYNAGSLQIAADGGANLLTGYESGFSFIKGSATYSGATITVPIAPVTATTNNTSLLLNFTNAGVIDSTAKNVIETVGNAGVVTAIKKYGSGSMYFDGTGDYLQSPDSELVEFGSGDFTIETWVRFAALPSPGTYYALVSKWDNSTQKSYVFYVYNLSGAYQLYFTYTTAGSTNINPVAAITPSINTWYHYAVSRSGANLRMFIDGTQVGSTYNIATDTIFGGTYPLQVGAATGANVLNGYMQDVRVTKGYARYTANFTPPTKALPTRGRAS